ncbi:MAG: hypothetical protein JWM36_3882 [Hyphomicrobiales bacterium]|nr:hypothetical protein [Hyphomicrobiales bacterium]
MCELRLKKILVHWRAQVALTHLSGRPCSPFSLVLYLAILQSFYTAKGRILSAATPGAMRSPRQRRFCAVERGNFDQNALCAPICRYRRRDNALAIARLAVTSLGLDVRDRTQLFHHRLRERAHLLQREAALH